MSEVHTYATVKIKYCQILVVRTVRMSEHNWTVDAKQLTKIEQED